MPRRDGSKNSRSSKHQPGSIRCAIYTRKSSDEGLEQEFNSLDAQREACEAFIISQRHEGWVALPDMYDDGGLSGGSMERPALKRLLADVVSGKIDNIVVYKVDRLTRSLADFAKIVDILDSNKASFVSVTQQFNTTTSMGRLTLNMLLSFAQFEREIAGERIRDKIAASKARGMWMGGNVPLGYDAIDRKLVINEEEAASVRTIFERYAVLGSVARLREELDRRGIVSKKRTGASGVLAGGRSFSRGALYTLLQNQLYVGKIVHRGQVYDGQHEAIIDQTLWDQVQAKLAQNRTDRRHGKSAKSPSLLAGLIYDGEGNLMTPSHSNKQGRRYRYYVSTTINDRDGTKAFSIASGIAATSNGYKTAPPASASLRIPAHEIDGLVVDRIRQLLQNQNELLDAVGGLDLDALAIEQMLKHAQDLADRWTTMASSDQRSVLLVIIERIDVSDDAVIMMIDPKGLADMLEAARPNDAMAARPAPISLNVGIDLKRSSHGAKIIVPIDQPNVDGNLIAIVHQAFQVREALMSGRHDSIEGLSKQLGVTKAKATNLLRLSWLAPTLVNAILDGDQPARLTPKTLLAAAKDLPNDWSEQAEYLGFSTH